MDSIKIFLTLHRYLACKYTKLPYLCISINMRRFVYVDENTTHSFFITTGILR